MAGLDASSPSLFSSLDGGLDAFDLGDGTLGDGSLAENLLDGGFGSSNPTTASATAAENITSVDGAGRSGTSSESPSAVSPPSHHQQPQPPPQPQPQPQQQQQERKSSQGAFFGQESAPQWFFDHTPPYDPPVSGQNPFGTVPAVPQQSWELPVHPNQPDTQQLQPQPQYFQYPIPSSSGPNYAPGTVATNAPPQLDFTSPLAAEQLRTIQRTLTPAQREQLKAVAMPPHLQYKSPRSAGGSPDSASSGHEKGAVSSPDAVDSSKKSGKKRKSSAEPDDDDDDDEDLEQPVKKTAHNMIEKRYRNNLNDKIAALRDSVPSLRIMCKSARGEDTTEDREELHGLTPAHKLNKATVLSKATEYIRHLEKRNNRLIEENNNMQARIAAFEKLFMAGAMTGQIPNPLQPPPTPMQFAQDPYLSAPMATPRGPDPPGMIPIPDDMKRILAAQQMNAGRPYPVPPQNFGQTPALLRQQQIQQQQQAQAQAGRWNPYLGKLMVGSLAGLMLLDSLVENRETADERELSWLPLHLLSKFVHSTHFSIGGYYLSAIDMIAKLKLFSLVGVVVWLAFSSFFDASVLQPSKKSKDAASVVKAVPSLASPIHVRRQAWLTAIQTVWVPRHNFFLEAAALLLKTAKYALRNVIGSHGYLAVTGLSEEQEAARIKAWSIALDAQLAGGDVEINKSRLTLTLIASGTLPDTPLRLMLKALHIRLLLWRFNGACWVANVIAAKLARSRWNEARQLNHILNSLPKGEASTDDALPEHLAALLEQDCDEVLNDNIIQRAHNLAWNQPTTYRVNAKVDGMDTVVEDAAVRSPMDAVAAWYSNLTLHRVLVGCLGKSRDDLSVAAASEAGDDIALAVKVAPIGSNAQVRALVARAVLAGGRRGTHIATALHALGHSRGVPTLPMAETVPDPDAQMALRCAMGIAQLQKFEDPPREAYAVIGSVLPPGADLGGMSLLGFTAAFHLMEHLVRHAVAREACSRSLERLAGSLRIWMGSESAGGNKAGVDTELRQRIVQRCLGVTKSVVGMEADPGYISMDDAGEVEDDGAGC